MSTSDAQSPKNQVFVRFTTDAAVKAFFPNAASYRTFNSPMSKSRPYAFVVFNSEEEAEAALNVEIEGVTIEAMKERTATESTESTRPERVTRDYTEVATITCVPDVCNLAMPEDAALTTVVDPTTSAGGHIFKRTEIETKHMQSVKFSPVVGSSLDANVHLGTHKFKIISIRVNCVQNSVFVSILVHHLESKTTGVVSLRRVELPDGTFSFSRHCFNVLVNSDDKEKKDEDEVDIHFVSVESITVDPATGLWTDLRLAIDAVTAPLSVYKRRGRRPTRSFAGQRGGYNNRPYKSGFRNQNSSRYPRHNNNNRPQRGSGRFNNTSNRRQPRFQSA